MARYRTAFVAIVLAASSYGLLLGTIPVGDTGQWRTAGSLSEPRSGAASVLLFDGAVLVTGGSGSEGSVATADVFGPTGDFSAVAAMRVPRAAHASVVLSDGSVLVVGGRNSDGAIAAAERFADGTWTDTEFLTDARWGHTATLLDDGRVLVAGGENGLGSVSSVEVFDPLTNRFSVVGTMAAPRKGHAAARLADGRVIIAGGFGSSTVLSSIDVYDPTTESVSPIATLNVARAGLSATTLVDGRVLFVGGNDGVDDLSSVELFNPVTGTVLLGASASGARRDHQAFLLPNNNAVLIVGGVTPAGATASAELYLPWVGDFRATGSMPTARTSATGSPLAIDGRLLVAGGDGLASSDVYAFATIRTDRDDYSPGMTVYVSGTGWLPNETVTFALRELPAEHAGRTFSITADSSGRIENAALFLVEDHHLGVRFFLTARGAASQAQITFTDGQAWALSISPTSVAGSSNTPFKLTVTNNSTTANGNDPMACVVLTVPSQFTASGTPTMSVPQGSSGWTISRAGNVITARATSSAQRLPGAGQQLTISFDATAPTSSTGSPFTFNVDAFGNINCSGGSFPQSPTQPTGGQPTVAVTTTSSVTFDATANPNLSDVSGTTPVLSVTVGANSAVSVLKSELPKTFSIASGTNVSYSFLATLASTADKQYRWLSTSGTGSGSGQSGQSGGPFTVTSDSTVTATYKAQYLQTFTQTGLDVDATGTVVTVDSDAKSAGQLSFSKFVDDGAAVSYSFTDPATSSVAGKRYRRSSVTGPATGYTVTAANVITGNYVAQWRLTLGVTAGVPGGLSNIGGGATATFYDSGTVLTLSATTPIADGVGKRWQFVNWTGDVSSPPNTSNPVSVTMDQARSIDATYAPQYRLSLAITAGVPGGLSRISGGTDGDFYNEGTVLSLAAETPVADVVDKQWRFANWSGSATGSTTPVTVTMDAAKSVTANYIAQYSVTFRQTGIGSDTTATVLTLTSPISATKRAAELESYSEWFDAGSSVVYSYAATLNTDPVGGKRYALTTTAPAAINNLTAAATVTGTYKTQYEVSFGQIGIGGDTTDTVLTITSPIATTKTAAQLVSFSEWFDAGSSVEFSYANTLDVNPAGSKRYTLTGTEPASPISNLQAPASVNGNYKTQYEITFAQTGIADDTGSNTVLTIGGSTTKVRSDLPFRQWFDEGSPVIYAYDATVSTNPASSKRYRRTSIAGMASNANVTGASTITGNYVTQWEVTFAQIGLDSDTGANTVVSIGTTTAPAGSLPLAEWFDDGSAVTYSYGALVNTEPASTKRYRRTSVTGLASGTNVTAASTVTANYIVQWAQTFTQSGLDTDATGTVVTVDGTPKMLTDPLFTTFVDAGATVAYNYTISVTSSAAGKKYRLDSVTGPVTGYVVGGAHTITGNYKAQYLLTLAITPGAPNALTNIGGATTGTFYDEGTILTLTAQTQVPDGTAKRWRFDNWTGDVTPDGTSNPLSVAMDQVRSIRANYVLQWQLTLAVTASVPGGVSATITGGTDGAFYDAGAVLSLTAATPVADGAGKQWRFDNWTGGVTSSPSSATPVSVTMNAPKSVNANYVVQWKLTLAITAGVPGGTTSITGGVNGTFYDTGTALTLAAQTPVLDGTAKRWRFDTWTGDVVPSPTGVVPVGVTMTAPKSVTANYVAQYLVTFEQTGINESTGPHTIVTVDNVAKTRAQLISGVSKFVDVNGSIAYAFSTPVSTDPISDRQYELTNAASLPTPVTVTSAMTIRGEYSQNTYSILYLRPIDQSTAGGLIINDGKNGRVIPVKVQILKNGTAIQSGTVIMGLRPASCTAGAASDLVTEYADAGNANGGSNLFRWSSDFWIYNLDTRALGLATGACYRLDVFMNQTNGPTGVQISNATWAVFRPVK